MNEQFEKLKKMVRFAVEHSAFYHTLYGNINVDTINSIKELPIVYSTDLSNNPFEFKADGVDIFKICMSSGTVSSPKVFFRTFDDYEHSVANEVILLEWAGVTSKDFLCIAQTFGISGYGELTLGACKKMNVPVLPIGEVSDELLAKCIIDFGITVLDISPSKFAKLSNCLNWEKTNVRLAMMSGEIIPNTVIKTANQNGIAVVSQYGSTEFDALAGQKIGDDFFTLIPDDFIFEIIDDKLVVTSLYHQGTPMIRYCLGDKVSIDGNKISILGRDDSILLFDGIKLFREQIENLLSSRCSLWQCLLYPNKNGVTLELLVMLTENRPNIEADIESEINNSTDIFGYVKSGEISVKCRRTDRFMSCNSRKFPRYVDLRNYSIDNLLELVNIERYDLFFAALPAVVTGKLSSEICELISTAAYTKRYACAKYLIRIWSNKSKRFGDPLFKSCLMENRKAVLQDIKKMATSENWGIREDAAKLFSVFLLADFSHNISWISKNLKGANENIRRAAMLGLKYACLDINEITKLKKMVSLLDGFLYDSSEYVRKSFDSFTIGDGFLNKCPEIVEDKLDEWVTRNDTNVNCIIIRVFKSSGGTRTWPLAKKYIDLFRDSDNRKVKNALASTVKYLSKRISEIDSEV